MSRIDEALQKAGLVSTDDASKQDAPGGDDAWDFDLVSDDPISSGSSSSPPPSSPVQDETVTVSRVAGLTPPEHAPVSPPPPGKDFPGLSLALHRSFEDKLLATPGMEAQSIEQFRRLAAVLHLMQENEKIKTILISSAVPSEGKTLTACNLALCLSGSYHRRVLLVDGDLRRPTIHELFQIPGTSGLSDWLHSDEITQPSIERVSKYLSVLPAGRPDPDPMGILVSHRMQDLLTDAGETVDWIILDSPPVGILSDGHLLSRMADAVVLVVHAGHTQHAEIQRTIDSLGRDRIAGVVLNQVEKGKQATHYEYGYGHRRYVKHTSRFGWLPGWMRDRRT